MLKENNELYLFTDDTSIPYEETDEKYLEINNDEEFDKYIIEKYNLK